jgi:hypothetical protein
MGIDDYFLWMRMLNAGMQFYNIQKAGILMRVGNDMISRRHGWRYFKSEVDCFARGLRIGYIGGLDFCIAVVVRGIVHLVPKPITKWMYNRFLRQK